MASNHPHKLKKTESKKSRSWLWDSHIVPKNNKWLQENLEEMDQYVRRMMKLIEEDADSFSKKAELYFKKRPELLNLVEEFYRMYRSLAERYDHVTGELRKRAPSDIQSQDSGLSEASPEPLPSPPGQKPSRTKSGPRAAGFDVFLGERANSSEFNSVKGEEDSSSSLDSKSDSDDDSSVNNYSEEQELRKKIAELEDEILGLKERIELQEKEIDIGCLKPHCDDHGDVELKIAGLEDELSSEKEKVQRFEEDIERLNDELQTYKSSADGEDHLFSSKSNGSEAFEVDGNRRSEQEISESAERIRVLEEELRKAAENLTKSEEEVEGLRQELTTKDSLIQNMQEQLDSSQDDASNWKNELEKQKQEFAKLQDRISSYENNLSERDEEIRALREEMSNANKTLSEAKERLQAEIIRISEEKTYLENNIKEIDFRRKSLEDESNRVKAAKSQVEESSATQIEQLKGELSDRNKELDAFKLKYDTLMSEKDNLKAKIDTLSAELSSKQDQINSMNSHLNNLHLQLVKVISKSEEAKEIEGKLRSRVRELEIDVKKKSETILEGAEEKREAIRQLCFSLEHYRSSYDTLRKAVVAHRRTLVTAS